MQTRCVWMKKPLRIRSHLTSMKETLSEGSCKVGRQTGFYCTGDEPGSQYDSQKQIILKFQMWKLM